MTTNKDAILENLKIALGETLEESQMRDISVHLDEMVQDRVNAVTKQLEEACDALQGECDKLNAEKEEKDAALEEEAKKFAEDLAESYAQKEAILFEEISNYKDATATLVQEMAEEYRESIEGIVLEEANNYKNYVDSIVIEEAKEYRISQEAALAEDVKLFQDKMVDGVDSFLEKALKESVSSDLFEAAAKAKAYETLVEGVVGVFKEAHVDLESLEVEALKEAQEEHLRLAEAYNGKVKESVQLATQVRELQIDKKLSSLTEGMTIKQKQHAHKLLEGTDLGDLDKKFNNIKDLIVEGNNKSDKTVLTESKTRPSKTASAERQVKALKESIEAKTEAPKSGFAAEMASWKDKI